MSNDIWAKIDYRKARGLYDRRVSIHCQLQDLYERRDIPAYVDLALGITDRDANYSASEHELGPRILQFSQHSLIFCLADQFMCCDDPLKIPDIVYQANLPYLKISVGSEMAAMLRPDVFWVTNIRTLWAYPVLGHDGDTEPANELLRLYREQEHDYHRDPGSHRDLDYSKWREFHRMLEGRLSQLAQLGSVEANSQRVESGELTFLWADAVADTMYNQYAWTARLPHRRRSHRF